MSQQHASEVALHLTVRDVAGFRQLEGRGEQPLRVRVPPLPAEDFGQERDAVVRDCGVAAAEHAIRQRQRLACHGFRFVQPLPPQQLERKQLELFGDLRVVRAAG